MKHFILLWFLTLGMVGYTATEATVTKVDNGMVTMVIEGREYTIEEAEAWRVGDRAECIMLTRGTADKSDDVIAEARYVWRK